MKLLIISLLKRKKRKKKMPSENIDSKRVVSLPIKPEWAIGQIYRMSGLIEDECKHGVGHPNLESLKTMDEFYGIHGCDGCCTGQ
jgi:hypothetical protein